MYILVMVVALVAGAVPGYAQMSADDPHYIELKQKIGNILKGLHQQTEAIDRLTKRLIVDENTLTIIDRKMRNMEYCNNKAMFYNSKQNKCIGTDKSSIDSEEEDVTCTCEAGSFTYTKKVTSSITRKFTASYPATSNCGEKWSGGDRSAVCTQAGWRFN